MVATISECPQSVQTNFIPAIVFSRTSWTVFEWHFIHSLETVSGLGISILYWHQANLTLFHLPQLWNKVLQARRVSGGVAKPGQTRRTQDRMSVKLLLLATRMERKKARWVIPSLRGSWVRIPPPPPWFFCIHCPDVIYTTNCVCPRLHVSSLWKHKNRS